MYSFSESLLDILEPVHNLPLDDEVDLDPELAALLDGEAAAFDLLQVLSEVDGDVVPSLHHEVKLLHDHLPRVSVVHNHGARPGRSRRPRERPCTFAVIRP